MPVKKYIAVVFMLMSLLACTKKPSIKYLDAGLKEQFYFKKGSYWIYKDSISGRMDSFYLESVQFSMDSSYLYALYDKAILEKMTINIVQTSLSLPYADIPIWKFSIAQRYLYHESSYQKGKIQFITYNPKRADTEKGKKEELSVLGNIFPIVSYFNSPNILYYLKEDIGYLKMHINYDDGVNKTNEVWELQRWHVVK
jgi:hypothetical protein